MKPPKPGENSDSEISESGSLCSLTSDSSEYDDCEKTPIGSQNKFNNFYSKMKIEI